jgi:hypothetical protein
MEKFKKPEFKSGHNPVDFFNENPNFEAIFKKLKVLTWDAEAKKIYENKEEVGHYEPPFVYITKSGVHGLELRKWTPFQLLCSIAYGGDYRQAIQTIEFKSMNKTLPYIRVGVNYFKRIEKQNRYGVKLNELKVWNKDTIKQDHGTSTLSHVHLFDDFTIEPDNIDYKPIINGMWNLYEPFPHKMKVGSSSIAEFPTTASFMAHVFGEQLELGYKYMKLLFEYPKQILPVLTLVSKERMTGKTTFLNWMDMIFGNNYVMVTPDDLTNSFNSSYAYKNIIGIDEAVVDRSSAVEKIKSIATANTMTVNEKMIAQYRIPFFGKLIITTNRETDFMRVDTEEIRFWVRKLKSIPAGQLTTNYEQRLLNEIPAFLRYLKDNVSVDFGRSRMVFTSEELANNELEVVKRESYSGTKKEILTMCGEFFEENQAQSMFYATLKDLKEAWFSKDSRISVHYLKKVLTEEMGMKPEKNMRYLPMNYRGADSQKVGTPYLFVNPKISKTVCKTEESSFYRNEDEPTF